MRGLASHPQIVHCVVDESRFKMRGLPHEAASSHHLVDDKFRLIRSQIQSSFFPELEDDRVEYFIGKRQPLAFALLLEDALVMFEAWPSDLDFVGEAA